MAIITTVGASDTEGYLDATAVKAYAVKHVDRYSAIATKNDVTEIEPAIRRATIWIDGLGTDPANNMSYTWPGERKAGSQRRQWPRVNAQYVDGVDLDGDSVPPAVIEATAEATCYEIINPNTLHGAITLSQVAKSSRIGPLSETTMGAETIKDARVCLTMVADLLAAVLYMPNDSSNFMFVTDESVGDRIDRYMNRLSTLR